MGVARGPYITSMVRHHLYGIHILVLTQLDVGTSLIKLGSSNSSKIEFLPSTQYDSQCNLVYASTEAPKGKGSGGPSSSGGGLFGKGKGTGGKGKGTGG